MPVRVRLLVRYLLLVCVPALAACASAAAANGASVTPLAAVALPAPRYHAELRPDWQYGPYAAQTLDLCVPAGVAGPRPGVVLIHGGAWMHGDKLRWRSLCLRLAAQGFVAASINYRLAPEWPWPAQLMDAQLAVRWLRAQAPSLSLDARHLCAYGDSAGGHLAVFLGVLHSIHAGDLAAMLSAQSPSVSCVVDDFAPTDLITLAPTPLGQQIAGPLFAGKTPQSDPALYRDASPVFAVTPASASMLLVQGTRDGVVPAGQSAELAQALRAQHVPVQYVTYDGDHEFNGLPAVRQRALEDLTIAFLLAHESA